MPYEGMSKTNRNFLSVASAKCIAFCRPFLCNVMSCHLISCYSIRRPLFPSCSVLLSPFAACHVVQQLAYII